MESMHSKEDEVGEIQNRRGETPEVVVMLDAWIRTEYSDEKGTAYVTLMKGNCPETFDSLSVMQLGRAEQIREVGPERASTAAYSAHVAVIMWISSGTKIFVKAS